MTGITIWTKRLQQARYSVTVMAQVGILEDNFRIARLCTTMLQYAGHYVIVYEHPRDCLSALHPSSQEADRPGKSNSTILKNPSPLDLLILDLHLPDIPGIQVLQSLRTHPRTRSLPLICCSAASTAEIEHVLRIAPHTFFVEKPFTYQKLLETVTAVLQAQEKE